MIELDTFSGLSKTPIESLKTYGFVCKNEKSDQHYCLYKVKDHIYDEGFFYESDLLNLIDEDKSYLSKEEIKQFFKTFNITKEMFYDYSLNEKLQKLIKFFGVETIFGKSVHDLTWMEAVSILEKE